MRVGQEMGTPGLNNYIRMRIRMQISAAPIFASEISVFCFVLCLCSYIQFYFFLILPFSSFFHFLIFLFWYRLVQPYRPNFLQNPMSTPFLTDKMLDFRTGV